ncbi:hypothetical protein [Hyalangium sp.]|uniref:hypothetical protein n=1 Tax=Hyalangium sp. TaxID=2028555 RepID=UPI002D34057A|nr:hypothetical protein [Hyalangium sp.]HYH95399.1 hypothetical protein [Hyalangium sp.]
MPRHVSKCALALVFTSLSSLAVGCGGVEDLEAGAEELQSRQAALIQKDEIHGKLVAQVRLSSTHSVEFWQLADGAIHLRELGAVQDLEKQLDYEALQGLSPIERFQHLAGPSAPAPASLIEAASLSAQNAPGKPASMVPWVPPPAPPEQKPEAGSTGRVVTPLIDWNADALWFQQNFCTWSTVDSVWCPTNVGWADAGSVYAMFYESTCFAASQSQSATYTTKFWNGSAWVTHAVNTVSPRYWQRWSFETVNWYTASCASINTGGDSRVDFSHRFRWGTPGISTLGDHPSDRTYSGGHSNDTQGVTHDSSYWFLTNTNNIWRVPVGTNLNDNPSFIVGNPWYGLYNHLGDISYGAGYLFLPLEKNGGSGSWCSFGVMNTALQYYNYAIVPDAGISDQGESCPWVAYNPRDGHLYASAFNASYINKYSWSVSRVNNAWQVNLAFVARIQIKDKFGNATSLSSLQGAEFSNTGKLYLVSDSTGLVYVMDIFNGRIQASFGVQVDHDSYEELEGITLWDVDSGIAPGVGGQIHVQMCDNDWPDSDDFYFKHYRASEVSKL